MHRAIPLAVVLIFTTAILAADQAPLETRGKIDAVTVYRGQALVTRLVDVPGPAALKELVVTDLPEQVIAGSIYAESADGVEVRSVSYRVRPVEKDVREEVRKFDDQLRALQDKIDASQRRVSLIAEQRDYLGKMSQFVAATGTTELSKGVLNAETLTKLTQFQFTERSRMSEEEQKLQLEQRSLNEEVQNLSRKRAQIATSSSRLAREAMVFVNLTNGAGGKLRLRYLVANAAWTPSYNIRTTAKHDAIKLEYLASVQQMSGEDWENVAMTLSTATPAMVAKAPALTELAISLTGGSHAGQAEEFKRLSQADYQTAKQELARTKAGWEQTRNFNINGDPNLIVSNASGVNATSNTYTGVTTINGGVSQIQQGQLGNAGQLTLSGNNSFTITGNTLADNNEADVTLNKAAGDLQMLDLLTQQKIVRIKDGKGPREPVQQEGLSVTYNLGNRTSLPSRLDRQLIQITSIPLKSDFYKVASPVLTNYVYDEANITNDSQTVLLSGPVATYVDNQFVGQGFLPTVAVGESFTAGLGIDSSLRASRELVERTESTQGGNRVVEFTYRLSIDNFGSSPVKVRLLDRMPTAKESEIKVTLLSSGQDLSNDPNYERTDHKRGILRWDVEVPAQAVGANAVGFEYQSRLEYDKQMSVGGLPSPAKK